MKISLIVKFSYLKTNMTKNCDKIMNLDAAWLWYDLWFKWPMKSVHLWTTVTCLLRHHKMKEQWLFKLQNKKNYSVNEVTVMTLISLALKCWSKCLFGYLNRVQRSKETTHDHDILSYFCIFLSGSHRITLGLFSLQSSQQQSYTKNPQGGIWRSGKPQISVSYPHVNFV